MNWIALVLMACTPETPPESKSTPPGPPELDEVSVPAGSFWMGCNPVVDTQCDADELPQHQVSIGGFQLDATEVTVGHYRLCVWAEACSEPYNLSDACNYGTLREEHPINCVDSYQAEAYCAWSREGGRLPTEAEWEMAARGACDGRPDCAATMPTYPWGDDDPSCDLAVMDEGFGAGCGGGGTWPVASIEGGISPYGAWDLSGNVWEWTADSYGAEYYGVSDEVDPTGPASGDLRVVRGGRFGGQSYNPAYLRSSNRDYASQDSFFFEGLGFRCAR